MDRFVVGHPSLLLRIPIKTMQPSLTTARLLLRPFTLNDAPAVQRLAGEYDVALNTALIPHPYPAGAAEAWVASHAELFAADKNAHFAMVLRATGELHGAIGLSITRAHNHAELGYWIGKPYWGGGFCTEAAAAVVRYGFTGLNLERIWAQHLARNPASGRVLQKVGMKHEGVLRQHFVKWNETQDVYRYGILRSELAPFAPSA